MLKELFLLLRCTAGCALEHRDWALDGSSRERGRGTSRAGIDASMIVLVVMVFSLAEGHMAALRV